MTDDNNIEFLKYPTGRFVKGKSYSGEDIAKAIDVFAAFPEQLGNFVKDWKGPILDIRYREGGWNARQVIHHLADSHGNLPMRVKTCLTEDKAEIKPYDENKWCTLYDANHSELDLSLMMLKGIHGRLADLFRSLPASDWERTIWHPESNYLYTLAELLAMYAWHGPHHLGHLKIIKEKS